VKNWVEISNFFELDWVYKYSSTKSSICFPGYAVFFWRVGYPQKYWVAWIGLTSNYVRYRMAYKGVLLTRSLGICPNSRNENWSANKVMVNSTWWWEVPCSWFTERHGNLIPINEVFNNMCMCLMEESMSPFFSPHHLEGEFQGGILGLSPCSGGGRKEEAWHTQGMKSLKYNSWKILIRTETLLEMGTRERNYIPLNTNSAGITVGWLSRKRPNVFLHYAEVPKECILSD